MTGPLFLRIIRHEYFLFMDREKLKLIVRNLESLVDALKSVVHSDVSAYSYEQIAPHIQDYDEIFEDDDGYPD